MSSIYAKFIAESAYKHSVDKPHTGNGIAFYEEPGRIAHRVDLDAIWTDAEYIPLDAPEVDEDGFYSVQVGTLKLRILQRLEDIPLDKVPGTKSTYKSVFLKDTIFPSYGTGYSITLKDWNNEVIPFGLNQWVIDPDNGEITFLAGWPEGYQELPKISFFRYVGRKANTTFLRADGSVKMDPGYVPTKDQDIATKAYVDSMTGDVSDIVGKLVPTTPPTLDKVDLELEYDRHMIGSPWNGEEKMPVVFLGESYKINIPQFYNPGKGEFHINVNGFDILDIALENVTGPKIYDYWTVTSVVDPYRNSKVANNFYKSINSYIILPVETINSLISPEVPYLTIYCYTYYDFTKNMSNPLTIGFENHIELPFIGNYTVDQLTHESGNPIKYISGVPTLKSGSTFKYAFDIVNLEYFKNEFLGTYKVNDFQEGIIYPNNVYDEVHPTHRAVQTITMPENAHFEKIDIDIASNDLTLENNINAARTYPIRVDSISDESARKVSPSTFNESYYSTDWTEQDARTSLAVSNELQMLEGLYQWPNGDYTHIGNFDDLRLEENISLSAVTPGPDYSNLPPSVRFVTFSYDMPICNGFWIGFENGQNIISDYNTHSYKNISQFRCEVEDQTGWLNMSVPYEGVLSPRETDEGCLVVASSNDDMKYITFGNSPLAGRLNITIGIAKNSGIKFSGIKIIFNK